MATISLAAFDSAPLPQSPLPQTDAVQPAPVPAPAADPSRPALRDVEQPRLQLLRLSDVAPKPVDWLWDPYLPKGNLVLLSGEPGAGTTYLALAVAAAVTQGTEVLSSGASDVSGVPEPSEPEKAVRPTCPGAPWKTGDRRPTTAAVTTGRPIDPDEEPSVGPTVSDVPEPSEPEKAVWPKTDDRRPTTAVIYLGRGDSPAHVLRPRLDALGGNPEHFHLLLQIPSGALPLQLLDEALRQTQAGLLIIDPVHSYLPKKTQEAEALLQGLQRLAEEHNCCILLIRHLARSRTGRVRSTPLDAPGLAGLLSSEILAGIVPGEPGERALVHARSSVGRIGPALGYAIDESGAFDWTGETGIDAAGLLAPVPAPAHRSALNFALEFLQRELTGGAEEVCNILAYAKHCGISQTTLQRAKERLGIISHKQSYRWYWALPRAHELPPDFRVHTAEEDESVCLRKIRACLRRISALAQKAKIDNLDNLESGENLAGIETLEGLARDGSTDGAAAENLGRVLRALPHLKTEGDLRNPELRNRLNPLDFALAWRTLEELLVR